MSDHQTVQVFVVSNWEKFFEGAKSKTYNNKTTCSMPNKHGLGYRKIIRSKNGVALFGAWCSLIQVLSKHDKPRKGYCTDTGGIHGRPYSSEDLEILTDIPSKWFTELFSIAQTVGWLTVTEAKDTTRIVSIPTVSPRYPLNSDSDSNLNSNSDSKPSADISLFEKVLGSMTPHRRESFEIWLQHKKEKGQSYKPTGFNALIKKNSPLSDVDLRAAVENSMAQNYSGIFPAKESTSPLEPRKEMTQKDWE